MITFKKSIITCVSLFLAAGYLYLALTPSAPLKTGTPAKNVGLLIVATGRYIKFVEPLVASAEKYFLPSHNRTFYIFTDHLDQLPQNKNIVGIYLKRIGWPYDSLLRCAAYYNNRAQFDKEDYIFSCDADLLFVDTVGDEILGSRVATQHPGFINKRGSYDINALSTACVHHDEGSHYFTGAFYGGQKNYVLEIAKTMLDQINKDEENKVMALWHDESHLNRYFIDHKPDVILSPSYYFPEGASMGYHPRIIALNKNHSFLRA